MSITNNGGLIRIDGKRLHGYKLSVWISDYNLANGTRYRPSTLTAELIQQFIAEVRNPYLSGRR